MHGPILDTPMLDLHVTYASLVAAFDDIVAA